MRAAELVDFWDRAISDFLAGFDPRDSRPQLQRWFGSYRSTGRGEVTTGGMPEPYIGSWTPSPSAVVLGLNPGREDVAFQGRAGIFAAEIAVASSYSAWAASAPYLRDPWIGRNGQNLYHRQRLTFAQRWSGDPQLPADKVLLLELYPWHSVGVTAVMAPDPALIDEFVWQPVADVDVPVVFAFGAPWVATAVRLGLRELPLSVSFRVPSRRVRLFELASGQRLVVLWHSGSAGPPNQVDLGALKAALGG